MWYFHSSLRVSSCTMKVASILRCPISFSCLYFTRPYLVPNFPKQSVLHHRVTLHSALQCKCITLQFLMMKNGYQVWSSEECTARGQRVLIQLTTQTHALRLVNGSEQNNRTVIEVMKVVALVGELDFFWAVSYLVIKRSTWVWYTCDICDRSGHNRRLRSAILSNGGTPQKCGPWLNA